MGNVVRHKIDKSQLCTNELIELNFNTAHSVHAMSIISVTLINKYRTFGHVAQTMLIRITCLTWFNLPEIVYGNSITYFNIPVECDWCLDNNPSKNFLGHDFFFTNKCGCDDA